MLAAGVVVPVPLARTVVQADPGLYLPATLMRVTDGDTIQVRLDSGPLKVRLHGIDAPERGQPMSKAATKFLRSELEGEPLEIEPIEQNDAYGRMVAKVLVRGEDVNARMVQSGYAWAYRQYLRHQPEDERYCGLEAEARAAGRGVWTGDPQAWQPPWEGRASKRGMPTSGVSYAGETPQRCIAAIGRRTGVAAEPQGGAATAPEPGCRIKGNINTAGVRIYHRPGTPSYANTKVTPARGERWFCSVEEAERAGWRPPRR